MSFQVECEEIGHGFPPIFFGLCLDGGDNLFCQRPSPVWAILDAESWLGGERLPFLRGAVLRSARKGLALCRAKGSRVRFMEALL